MNQNIAYYCIGFCSKKWCAPFLFPLCLYQMLLFKIIGYCIENLLCTEVNLQVVSVFEEKQLMHRIKSSTQQRGTPHEITLFKGRSNENRVPTAVRYDGIRHYPLSNPTERRCGVCNKKSRYVCTKCDVALHIDCFENYLEST